MEGLEEISDILFCPLTSVDIEFNNTKVDKALLLQTLSLLLKSNSVYSLQENLIKSLQTFESLDSFKSCEAIILPGKSKDSALVSFNIQDNKLWTLSAGADANNEGGRTVLSASFRNLREKADLTNLQVEYKPNTKTYGFELYHLDKLYVPGKWQLYYSIKQGTEEIDVNLKQVSYGGSVGIRTLNGNFRSEIGRFIRTNKINTEFASLQLISEALPVSAKNYILTEFKQNTLDNFQQPSKGSSLTLTSEIACGADNVYQKLDFKFNKFFGLTTSVVLQSCINFGLFVPWNFTKVSINDRYRSRFIKGFHSVGHKKMPADPVIASKYDVTGDDLGEMSKLILEQKVQFYDAGFLSGTGLTPFLYANCICEAPLKYNGARSFFREYVRGSFGFGIGLNLGVGKLEVAYAARVFRKTQDVAASLQVVFGD